MEDKYVIRDLYLQVNNTAIKVVDDRNNTLITNLCLLSVLQFDILTARALAFANWKSKVSTGEYNFDAIEAVITGPESVELGTPVTFKLFSAGINSNQKPEIIVNSQKDCSIVYNNDGTHSLTFKPKTKGEIILSGTITITNKSGIKQTENWEKLIKVN